MHFSYLVLPPCEDVGEEDIPRSVQVPKRKDISSSVNFAGLEASDHRESSGVPLCTWPLRTRTILHLINGNSPTFLNRSFFLVPISSVEKKNTAVRTYSCIQIVVGNAGMWPETKWMMVKFYGFFFYAANV